MGKADGSPVQVSFEIFDAIGFLYPAIFKGVFGGCSWVEQVGTLCYERQEFVDIVRSTNTLFDESSFNLDTQMFNPDPETIKKTYCKARFFIDSEQTDAIIYTSKDACIEAYGEDLYEPMALPSVGGTEWASQSTTINWPTYKYSNMLVSKTIPR